MKTWLVPIVIYAYLEQKFDSLEEVIYESVHDISEISPGYVTVNGIKVHFGAVMLQKDLIKEIDPDGDFPDLDNFDGEGRRYGSGY